MLLSKKYWLRGAEQPPAGAKHDRQDVHVNIYILRYKQIQHLFVILCNFYFILLCQMGYAEYEARFLSFFNVYHSRN